MQVELIRSGGLLAVALVSAFSAWKAAHAVRLGEANAQKLDKVSVAVDGTNTVLTKDLAAQTAKASYLEGMVDKWLAIEKRNDLLNATPPPPHKEPPPPEINDLGKAYDMIAEHGKKSETK